MTKTDCEWIEILGEDFNKDLPLDMQIEEHEAKASRLAVGSIKFSPASLPGRLTGKDFQTIGRFVAETVGKEIDALKKRIEELEGRGDYHGVWREGMAVGKGWFVTHAGSVWHANRATCDRPGTSDAFTLAVKKGKDAR